ncbi:MAG TPA: helix-turn-helix transcriptional regulator [Candidatus Angelobacter sp.]|nr:helix-turn-helix transcriptional regulator [Candidatus Angelobacter sp.]
MPPCPLSTAPTHCRKEGRMPNHPSLPQIAKSLGARIRQLRKKKGWTQHEFAVICHLHRSHMGKIERGETNLRLATLVVIARNLDTRVEELLVTAEGRR